jgi:hypothetical protein
MSVTDQPPLVLAAAFFLAVVAVGRAARLATHDDWPPGTWVRTWWVTHTNESWGTLWLCPFCWAPYAAAIDLAWAVASGLDAHHFWGAAWWIVNTWAALSYLAAILVTRDEPPE